MTEAGKDNTSPQIARTLNTPERLQNRKGQSQVCVCVSVKPDKVWPVGEDKMQSI